MTDQNNKKIFLKELANNILNEARSSESNLIFSATGFSRNNISIIHQQKRCENLSWALKYLKKVKKGDVIGIIGGSFSGITLASFLAVANDVIVYIFEKEDILLKKFLNSANRYISPNLNSRELGRSFNPEYDNNTLRQILFDWKAGLAHDVANQWLKEFNEYEKRLPIFCFFNKNICKKQIRLDKNKVIIDDNNIKIKSITLDILIDATGFGEEINPHKIKDYSYWDSGHKLIYNHLGKNDKVLISGVGDSGIIEVLQYALKDFEHDNILGLWQNRTYEYHIDTQRPQAIFDDIFELHDISFDEKTIFPEITWWLSCKDVSSWSGSPSIFLEADEFKIYNILEKELNPIFKKWSFDNKITSSDFDTYQYFISQSVLSLDFQKNIRMKLEGEINKLASLRLKKMIDQIDIGKVLDMQALSNSKREIQIIYNGLTPTPYTINLSPYNLWLTKIVMSIPKIKYQQGKIKTILQNENGTYEVKYTSGKIETFNRVITRYGISKERNNFFSNDVFNPQKGDFMLNGRFYANDIGKTSYRDLIHRKIKKLIEKNKSKTIIHKKLYKMNIVSPISVDDSVKKVKSIFPKADENFIKPIFELCCNFNYQSELSDLLKRGRNISYASDFIRDILFIF